MEGKIIMIGEPIISSIALARLMEMYNESDIIAFGTIGYIDEPMKLNHSFECEISHETMEALLNFGCSAKIATESINSMKEAFKDYNKSFVPLENEPSKYISKPKYNFKKR